MNGVIAVHYPVIVRDRAGRTELTYGGEMRTRYRATASRFGDDGFTVEVPPSPHLSRYALVVLDGEWWEIARTPTELRDRDVVILDLERLTGGV